MESNHPSVGLPRLTGFGDRCLRNSLIPSRTHSGAPALLVAELVERPPPGPVVSDSTISRRAFQRSRSTTRDATTAQPPGRGSIVTDA